MEWLPTIALALAFVLPMIRTSQLFLPLVGNDGEPFSWEVLERWKFTLRWMSVVRITSGPFLLVSSWLIDWYLAANHHPSHTDLVAWQVFGLCLFCVSLVSSCGALRRRRLAPLLKNHPTCEACLPPKAPAWNYIVGILGFAMIGGLVAALWSRLPAQMQYQWGATLVVSFILSISWSNWMTKKR